MQSLERIDRYRLERRLGSGAFGVVWLAHDDVLEAPVAVKVLAENWAHRLDIRERFLSEARLLRRAAQAGWCRSTTSASSPTAGPISSWSTPTAAPSPTGSTAARSPWRRPCA
ncbi:hypothetical protein ACFQ0G_05580 [Streptomyces chiangmaiensis]